MANTKLMMRRVEKPWGRRTLWHAFDDAMNCDEPIGEIWFEMPNGGNAELLIKYLFTSQKLSIQVHPDDDEARARGYPRGKDEAWLVLDADPGAAIALGMRKVMTREALRAAALDGTIEDHLFWQAVKAGDFFYTRAGTIHAIGEGVTLVEVQQNVDLTYRLWDYGRPRELHLEDGIAVADPVPYVAAYVPQYLGGGRTILCDGPKFVLERLQTGGSGALLPTRDRPLWLVPLAGEGTLGGEAMAAGEVWVVDSPTEMSLADGSDLLIAYPGKHVVTPLWARE